MNGFKVTFKGSLGETLDARLELPNGKVTAFALFAHCFTCGKDSRAAVRISRALAARGIAVLRFDFTGLGGSGGDFGNTNFSSNVADLIAAADYLRAEHQAPTLLIGHSLGGTAVLAAAAQIPESAAVVTIGAPFDAEHVEQTFLPIVSEIETAGQAVAILGGRSFTIRKDFLDDLRRQHQHDRIAHLGGALLVMHAPMDTVVGIDNASRIFAAANHPKSFVSLDRADHFFTQATDADYAAGVMTAWASRYMPVELTPEAASLEYGRVLVEETGRGRFQQRITIGPHGLLADEPATQGGLGSGPTPYDLLAASLGACKSMTMRLYAERKGWSLDRVRIAVTHDRVHAADCADCETAEGRIDEVRVEIDITGDLSAKQRTRIVEIAERCPVHLTLTREVKIRTATMP